MNEFIDQQKAYDEMSIATANRVGYHAKSEDFSKYISNLQERFGSPITKEYVSDDILNENIEEIDLFDPRRYLPEPNAIGKLQALLGNGVR